MGTEICPQCEERKQKLTMEYKWEVNNLKDYQKAKEEVTC